jgi:small subunit ribosomal protein S13
MVYLFESELPESKSIWFSLRHIYGISGFNAILICKKLGFSKNLKIKNLSKEQLHDLIKIVELLDLKLASDLKKFNLFVVKRLVSIKSYRGLRKTRGLPVRGQRTHTNAKTSRKIR